jgi:hypothetical protein
VSVGRSSQACRIVGGIVPPGLMDRIRSGEVSDRASLSAESYHLAVGESVGDAANRAFSYLRGAYAGWREAQERQPGSLQDTRAQLVRDRWLLVLLRELGYGTVLATPAAIGVDGREYAVSHAWGHVPIHLLGPGVDLDRRNPGVAGAARAPQAMVQELLNRTDEHLWGIVSNGLRLRLLRDSTALAGPAYLEFDLEAVFEGELFADFLLLWQLVHVSRLEKRSGPEGSPGDCWLEDWRLEAVESGVRLLDRLRHGVKEALEVLGTGFIRHPSNAWLVDALRDRTLSKRYYRAALLRLVYRLLFLFVAEDRDLLLDPHASPGARERYAQFFSMARLRRLSRSRSGGPHGDLWEAHALVLRILGGDGTSTGSGEAAIGLPALGGLFEPDARLPAVPGAPESDLLVGASLSNHDFLMTIRLLGWAKTEGGRVQPVDYRNLGSEELGGVYESLLELNPEVDLAGGEFHLEEVSGNERKLTGSYYTPSALVSLVLDEALDPLLDRAVAEAIDPADAERRLLEVTVCDPACGSGHFLVAAARRIAQRLAQVRSGEDAPASSDVQHAMREVVSRCIYGVDVNDLAAELAKVSLWLEALEPGKALGFLDAHVKVGNSLLGTTPALLADGIPETALAPIEGDDKKAAAFLKKQNRQERSGQGDILTAGGISVENMSFGREVSAVVTARSDTLDDVHEQAKRLKGLELSTDFQQARLLADAWCAAFVQPKTPDTVAYAITFAVLEQITDDSASLNPILRNRVEQMARDYGFFHWHLEFPHIFSVTEGVSPGINEVTGWTGGFQCVVGNPPWERVKLQEQEFFASRDEKIANARNAAARKALIAELDVSDPVLANEWAAAKRQAEGVSHLIRDSKRYPLCGVGDVNTYSVFAEHFGTIIARNGRMGIITPTGLATDATTAAFFADAMKAGRLASFYDFENEAKIFPGVHHAFRFAITCLTGGEHVSEAKLAFVVRHIPDLPPRRFALAPEEVLLLNPNTGTLPLFRSRVDAEITLGIYRRHPVLVGEGDPQGNPWGVSFLRMFDMANDSRLFRTADYLEAEGALFDGWAWSKGPQRWLPLYEAKLLSHYDHRYSTYRDATQAQLRMQTLPRVTDDEHDNPQSEALVRYWVDEAQVAERLAGRWDRNWLLGWRDITGQEKWRTFVPCVLPRSAVGHKFPLVFTARPEHVPLLQAAWSSLVFDYVSRQKLSGTGMTYFIVKQLACPGPVTFEQPQPWSRSVPLSQWLLPRVLELAYTSWRIQPYAVDLGDESPPFRWVAERRELIRAELDAAMMHVYGLKHVEVEHVLESFPVVSKYEHRDHGEYRTKRLVLEIYDAMAEAMRTGVPYTSVLDPEPGHGPRHPESSRPAWADLYQ